jgi:hypothetical protein
MISVAIATIETMNASMTMNSASGSGFVGLDMPLKDAKTEVLAMSDILRRSLRRERPVDLVCLQEILPPER